MILWKMSITVFNMMYVMMSGVATKTKLRTIFSTQATITTGRLPTLFTTERQTFHTSSIKV